MEYFDFYGTSYDFNVLGKSSYKTALSLISSLITIVLVGVGIWLIGRDMIYKSNPKVIESTYLPDQAEPVYINNRNFTFAFKLEDQDSKPVADNKAYAFPHFYYEIFKRDEEGILGRVFEKIYTPVPCLQTEAKENPLIQKFNPETLNCFDMAQIKDDLMKEGKIEADKDIDLYGGFDEDYVSAFYLVFTNCKYKEGESDLSTCVSYEEAVERNKNMQFLSFYLPRVVFSPENYGEPVRTYFDNISYTMSPHSSLVYKMRYSLFTLSDDRGWIFEDIRTTVMADLVDEDKEYRFLEKEAFSSNSANMVSIDLNFQRKQLKRKRVYMKIQELAANLGGLMKAVVVVFQYINRGYSMFKIESTLIQKYIASRKKLNNRNNSSDAAINGEKPRVKVKMTLWEYFLISLNCSKKSSISNTLSTELKQKMDIETILKTLLRNEENQTEMELNTIRLRNND